MYILKYTYCLPYNINISCTSLEIFFTKMMTVVISCILFIRYFYIRYKNVLIIYLFINIIHILYKLFCRQVCLLLICLKMRLFTQIQELQESSEIQSY